MQFTPALDKICSNSSTLSCDGRLKSPAVGLMGIKFTCEPEDVKKIKSFLAQNVRGIDVPVTGQVSTSHGTFGQYSRYKVVQHKYAGGGYGPSCGGCIEVLEIKNPPMSRHRIVIYEFSNGHGV